MRSPRRSNRSQPLSPNTPKSALRLRRGMSGTTEPPEGAEDYVEVIRVFEEQFGSEELDFLRELVRDVLRDRLHLDADGASADRSDHDALLTATPQWSDLSDSLNPSEVAWDVIANEVASRLGRRLPGIEDALDVLLPSRVFRQSLADWNPPADFILARAARIEEARLKQCAVDALATFDIDGYVKALHDLDQHYPDSADKLRTELPDLNVVRTPSGRRIVALWRLLDGRSPLRPRTDTLVSDFEPPASADTSSQSDARQEPTTLEPHPTSVGARRPEALGDDLEEAMHDLLEQLFDLNDPAKTGWKLRRQKRGEQYGFDLSFRAPSRDTNALCLVECKNYSSPVSFDEIAAKVLQAKANWSECRVDHWILVSPHSEPDNRLDRMIEQWAADRDLPFSVQIWSPATGVRNLFMLSAKAHEQLYGFEPPELDDATISEVQAEFRRRVKPYLRIPVPFLRAAKDPRRFLHPSDRADWPALLGAHLPRHGLTETRAPLPLPLTTTVLDWIDSTRIERDSSMLILGEFGEGKSFFTFEVAVAQVERFLVDPESAAFPLRMILKDFRHATTPEQFLEGQLARLGASMVDYYELVRSSGVVVILDGIDEMSVRQDGRAITENLGKLRDLLNHLADVPVLMTSRPHFFESSSQRDRFYDRLRRPVVYRLGQPDRGEALDHLYEHARATGHVEKLVRLNGLRDPIALSRKMLFLQMIKTSLPDLPDDHFSEVVLYNTYIDGALRRKIELLEDPQARLSHEQQIRALKSLLEDIAVVVHQEGHADLRSFAGTSPGIATILWELAKHSVQTDDYSVEDDAAARVGMRSLLRKVSDDEDGEWRVDFFHRSLKEFFVAQAIVRGLTANDGSASLRALLSRLALQPEISRFVGQLCAPLDAQQVHARLSGLLQSSVRALGECSLGGNALSILHRCGGQLSNKTWPDLCLDSAWLVGADLTNTDLRRSSMRWANLDNAVLTHADLRDADLTGVRLEETAVITDMTVDGSGRPIVLYEDNSIRRWELDGSHMSEVLHGPSEVERSRIEALDDGLLLVRDTQTVGIWIDSGSGAWTEVARFPSASSSILRIAFGRSYVGILLYDYNAGRSLVVVTALATAAVLWTASDVGPVFAACDSVVALIDKDGALVLHDSLTGALRARTSLIDVVGASVREGTDGIDLSATTRGGDLHWLHLSPSGALDERGMLPALHNGYAECIVWVSSGVASGGGGREVVLTSESANGIVESGRLARWLRCERALVAGLCGNHEREILMAAGAVQ